MTALKPAVEVFDIQREYTEGVEPFRFRWADQEWELPHRKMLDFSKLLQVAQMQDKFSDVTSASIDDAVDTLNATFTMLMGDEQGKRFAQVNRPLDVLMLILSKWSDFSGGDGAETGESSASASSSTSTGRPSKRTSNGSTASGSPKPSSRRARKTATPRVSSSSASGG